MVNGYAVLYGINLNKDLIDKIFLFYLINKCTQ
jgi:hypothetical protein